MKKILLATSILAATTGFAAAEVALTGDARMGVVYDGEDVQFSQRARVRFNLSGQTDTGLEFGATFRADQAADSANGGFDGQTGTDKRGNVWISGAFGKLAMGDVNSAAEEAFGDLTEIGFSGLNGYTDIPYINGDEGPNLEQGPGALYTYATGAFEFHLGLSDGSSPNLTNGRSVLGEGAPRDTTYSVAAAYSADTFKVGLGYLDNGDVDTSIVNGQTYGGSQWIVYGSTELSGFGLKAYYSSFDDVPFAAYDLPTGAELDKSYGLTVDYAFGATTVTGFIRRDEVNSNIVSFGDEELDTFGIGAVYDLGGGASLNGGVVHTDRISSTAYTAAGGVDTGETIADFGVKLKF